MSARALSDFGRAAIESWDTAGVSVLQDSPNPDRPEDPFKDGPHTYEVTSLPAALPTALARPAGGLEGVLFALVAYGAAFGMDNRMKVVVLRRRTGELPSWPRVMHVEFVLTPEDAERRERELVATWRSGQYTHAPSVGWRAQRQLRQRSRE